MQASVGASITIDEESNVQDNVKIYGQFTRNSTDEQKVQALGLQGVTIAGRVIVAHGATVKGPAQLGVAGSNIPVDTNAEQEVFLSFGSEVDGAILEKNTSVAALGRVGPGVRLKSGKVVLPGKNVTTQAEADNPALGKVRWLTGADIAFSEAVIEVNEGEYTRLAKENLSNVQGINYDPGNTTFNPDRDLPTLDRVPTRDPNFRNRIIGQVDLADSRSSIDTVVGNRISLRADEGEPFTVGRITRMNDDVTFHALEETNITIGNNVTYGTGAIVHGGAQALETPGRGSPQLNAPTVIGNNVTLKNQSVVFSSTIGQGSTIGVKSAVVTSNLLPSTTISDRIIYLDNAVFGTVEW